MSVVTRQQININTLDVTQSVILEALFDPWLSPVPGKGKYGAVIQRGGARQCAAPGGEQSAIYRGIRGRITITPSSQPYP
ncbi:hypothetical protein IMP84_03770 [Escherichia coli]|nr:hypothetical protein [Escherichia coli]QPE68999.1 hypothetical protein IMP84_03770 [Escherichia coli]